MLLPSALASRHLLSRHMASAAAAAAAAGSEMVQVCFVDPRTVRDQPQEALAGSDKACLHLPADFLPKLSQGRMELGELDDPMNTWHFGKQDELFKYRLCFTLPTMSGFTGIIERGELEALCSPSGRSALPPWEELKAELAAGRVAPFLFAGTVLDAPAAAVYTLKEGGQVVGIAVSSEAAE